MRKIEFCPSCGSKLVFVGVTKEARPNQVVYECEKCLVFLTQENGPEARTSEVHFSGDQFLSQYLKNTITSGSKPVFFLDGLDPCEMSNIAMGCFSGGWGKGCSECRVEKSKCSKNWREVINHMGEKIE